MCCREHSVFTERVKKSGAKRVIVMMHMKIAHTTLLLHTGMMGKFLMRCT